MMEPSSTWMTAEVELEVQGLSRASDTYNALVETMKEYNTGAGIFSVQTKDYSDDEGYLFVKFTITERMSPKELSTSIRIAVTSYDTNPYMFLTINPRSFDFVWDGA